MPFKTNKRPTELTGFEEPIGLDPKRCLDTDVTLIVRKPLSWSLGDFEVKNAVTDEIMYTCRGKFNAKQEKDIYDAQGNTIFHLSTKFWSCSRVTTVTKPEGEPAFTLSRDSWKLAPKIDASFTDALTNEVTPIFVDGTMKRGRATVLIDGEPVAAISRDSIVTKDARQVIISPNVDVGLVIAVVVMFDMCLTETVASFGVFAPILTATSY